MKLLTIMALMLLASCGGGSGGVPKTIGGNNTGNGCTIEAVANLGVNITCDGETVFVPNGAKGEKGDKGDEGVQGETGNTGTDGQDGADGFNVFAKALSIHTSKRKSVFRLTVACSQDLDGDGIYGETNGDDTLYKYVYGDSFYNYNPSGQYYTEFISEYTHTGTGWLSSDDEIITNKHVIGDTVCSSIKYYNASSNSYTASRIPVFVKVESVSDTSDSLQSSSEAVIIERSEFSSHPSYDLAKIAVTESFSTGRNGFEIETADETILTPTLSMSFPFGINDMITNIGEVSADTATSFTGSYDFMTSNDTDSGSSGSPIIDITTGKVIGVLTAGFVDASMNPSIVIHADRLNDF